jgi:hypothetical protein
MTRFPRPLSAFRRESLVRVPSWAVAVTAGVVLCAADAFGCPNCKDAVNTADPEGLNVARGYFYSILLMLAMPGTLLGSFGIYVWRETRRLKRAEVGAPGPAVVAQPYGQWHGQSPGPREP